MSLFYIDDEDKGIITEYFVGIEEVLLDFDSRCTPGSKVQIYDCLGPVELRVMHNCPRPLVWKPSPPLYIEDTIFQDLLVKYEEWNGGPPRTHVLVDFDEVVNLTKETKYQDEIAHFEIKRDSRFCTSTTKFVVRKQFEYRNNSLKLSVVVEYIDRDEWNDLLDIQNLLEWDAIDVNPALWRGNENDVVTDLIKVAHEFMPLLLKQDHAQHKAIQQGLSHSDFSWDTPYHETRIVRHTSSPFSQRDSCLRSLRLEIVIGRYQYLPGFDFNDDNLESQIESIQLNITPITFTPSHPNTFSSLNNFHLDIPHSPPTDGSIRNSSHHAQTLNVSNNGMATLTGTNSSVAGTGLTVNGSVIILNVNGPLHGPLQVTGQVTGDIFSGPIYNSNVGGRYNTNQIAAQPDTQIMSSMMSSLLDNTLPGPRCGSSYIPRTEGCLKRRWDPAMHDASGVYMEQASKQPSLRTGNWDGLATDNFSAFSSEDFFMSDS